MDNCMIRNRLLFFQAELAKKARDSVFTVSETSFICERAIMLVNGYRKSGINALRTQTLVKLQAALEQADLYFACYNGQWKGTISINQVVDPAQEAIDYFLKGIDSARAPEPAVTATTLSKRRPKPSIKVPKAVPGLLPVI